MSRNMQTVRLDDGREVCLSYGVIVAAFIPHEWCPFDAECYTRRPRVTCVHCKNLPRGYVRTDARYSVTTSKHMNTFAGSESPTIPDAELRRLVAPVTDRRVR